MKEMEVFTQDVTAKRAFLDTTVQLDRVKFAARKEQLDEMLRTYQLRFATSLSLVEFKATIIQECITIHNQLRVNGARFTWCRDRLIEKRHPQVSLRAHIFNNLINVFVRFFRHVPRRGRASRPNGKTASGEPNTTAVQMVCGERGHGLEGEAAL